MRNYLYNKDKTYSVDVVFVYEGYLCVVCSIDSGHRTGYVALKEEDKDMIEDNYWGYDFEVHGGITFNDKRDDYPVPTLNKVHWLGFDCNHHGDKIDLDILERFNTVNKYDVMFPDDTIKDEYYVIKELKYLVLQIKNKRGELNEKNK